MTTKTLRPNTVFADASGNIYDHPELLMVCRRGEELALPRPQELMPLPEESRLFLLPGRNALGYAPETGALEQMEEQAVAAFISPGHTCTGVAAYTSTPNSPVLPMFSYGAVGYADGRFWVAAKQVDTEPRQVFTNIQESAIKKGAAAMLKALPGNRLAQHLAGCALSSQCPAARNLCLGRYEAPLPTARACNAKCVGCLSLQPEDSGFPAVQNRLDFAPTAKEIVAVMNYHDRRAKRPIHSFGQGCEGDPLTEADRIAEAIRAYRHCGGQGTVNCNTNGSSPAKVEHLVASGLDSMRVSMIGADDALYTAYHNPQHYTLSDVKKSITTAVSMGCFVSINLLYFPGITDTESEYAALEQLIVETRLHYIQWRNLNLDPELVLGITRQAWQARPSSPAMGFVTMRKRLKKACPWLGYGYFNPAVRHMAPQPSGAGANEGA